MSQKLLCYVRNISHSILAII